MASYLDKLKTTAINNFNEQDETAGRDIARIEISSRLLQISEFQFFHVAYQEWCGKEIDDDDMEHIFTAYLLSNDVPFWVRDFARDVLSYYTTGNCEAREFSLN